jgi:cytidine deaminase
VGAAILTKSGNIFSGCNVENASYGATVCAERVATWKALSSGDRSSIVGVYVIVNAKYSWPPCGLCRQVLVEFAHPKAKVFCEGLSGKVTAYNLSALIPNASWPHGLHIKT